MDDKKILIGADEIKEYVGFKSDELFKNFLKKGLPAKLIDNRWYAHKDNIDRYFKNLTNIRKKKAVPDVIN